MFDEVDDLCVLDCLKLYQKNKDLTTKSQLCIFPGG